MLQEIELLQKLHGIGRVFDLVDTAGIEEIKNNEIQEQMMIQTDTAIEIADVVLFLTSIKEGVQRDDLEILKKLKKAKKKMVLAVNKCDKLRRNKSGFL